MYDAIVVGARRARAPTARLLARKGDPVLPPASSSSASDPPATRDTPPPRARPRHRWGPSPYLRIGIPIRWGRTRQA